jgi:hypothetical protein
LLGVMKHRLGGRIRIVLDEKPITFH